MSKEKTVRIYTSMLLDKKWQALSVNTMLLYIYIKAEYTAGNIARLKYAKLDEDNAGCCVTISREFIEEKYLPKRGYEFTRFRYDLNALINAGFVELVEAEEVGGEQRFTVLLSSKWHTNKSIVEEVYINGKTANEYKRTPAYKKMLDFEIKAQKGVCACGKKLGKNFHTLMSSDKSVLDKMLIHELLCDECYTKRKVNGRIRPTQEIV